MKRNGSEKLPSFSLQSEMKRNGSKKPPSFSLRIEIKRNGSEKLPSFSLRSEMKQNGSDIFKLRCEKSVFSLVFTSGAKRKLNEAKIKRKRSENFKAKQEKVQF
jgi:hypothetical protein